MAKKTKKSNKIETPAIICTNRETYLGTMDGNTVSGVTLSGIPRDDSNFSNLFGKYILNLANGDLESTIVGNKDDVSIRPLKKDLDIEFDRCLSLWNLAQEKSKTWAATQVFNSLLGK